MFYKARLVEPRLCLPPHRITSQEAFQRLLEAFLLKGWDHSKPSLVGYVVGNKVQLLSGSHRWAAALESETKIPVVVLPKSLVEEAWGNLVLWRIIMEAGGEVEVPRDLAWKAPLYVD